MPICRESQGKENELYMQLTTNPSKRQNVSVEQNIHLHKISPTKQPIIDQ